jgi:hypothetical protein
MSDTKRQLTMTISGPDVEDGKISFSVLANKLDALQKALFNVALARSDGPVAQRGNWSKRIRASCELLFCESHKGSLTIVAEIPPHMSIQATLNGEKEDEGLRALKTLRLVSESIAADDCSNLVSIMPDSGARLRALKSIETLCPRDTDNFWVALGNGTGQAYAQLTSESRKFIQQIFTDDDVFEIQTVNGDLVEIRVLAGRRHIVIRSRQKEITCYYPTEMEETVSQLVAGSLVEVKGRAQLNDDGSIRQIDEILDISTIDLSPFRASSFQFNNKRFILKEPVICSLEFKNNLWIYECQRYGLHTFSEDRQEALLQLGEEFVFLYDGLIHEPDENLTYDAIELRNLIKSDVVRVEEI